MKVETLEYGGREDLEYPEHWNSFKIMTIWSEPETELSSENEINESSDQSPIESKRLVTAVEFQITHGSYFFIEKPSPNPEWLNKVFDLLKEEGWQGHSFNIMRNNCRGEINIEKEGDYTAVIDKREEIVLHNMDKREGGEKTSLENWKN